MEHEFVKDRNIIKTYFSTEGILSETDKSYFIKIPDGKYGGYAFNFPKSKTALSQFMDREGRKEDIVEIEINTNFTYRIKNYTEERIITGEELLEAVGEKLAAIYRGSRLFIFMTIPRESIYESRDNSLILKTPKFCEIPNYAAEIQMNYFDELSDGNLKLSIPNGDSITFRPIEGLGKEVILSAYQMFKRFDSTKKSDYDYQQNKLNFSHGEYYYFTLPAFAIVTQGPSSTLIKMPKGDYEGYLFFVSNAFVKEINGRYLVSVPKDNVITIFEDELNEDGTKRQLHISPEHLNDLLEKTKDEDYKSLFEMRENKKSQMEEFITNMDNIPEEMKNNKNWVAMRVTFNEETNHMQKMPIDVNRGCAAKIDDPSSFATFDEACEYAHKYKCKTVAYALDGKDNISCIDVDQSIKDGKKSEILKKVLKESNGTYAEKSVSGNGAHIFFKMEDKDKRAFSKDGDLELYQKKHFIAMTGDLLSKGKEIKTLDGTNLEKTIEEKFNSRVKVENANKQMEGITNLSDLELIEKAKYGSNGDKFEKLYKGQDIYNDHSRSDMSLMSALAYYSNGDKEQMLRIFATSGLYRPSKSSEYYEYSASKAIEYVKDVKEEIKKNQKSDDFYFKKNRGKDKEDEKTNTK